MADVFALIDSGDVDGIRRLLADDPSAAEARDDQGLSPIVHAVYRGQSEIAALLRPLDGWDRIALGGAEGLPAPGEWSPDGFTPLHIAAFAHNASAARRLLEQGADPDVVARASFARVTPLGTCAFAGANEVARVLLEHGADPAVSEVEGEAPADVARANGNDELAALLSGD